MELRRNTISVIRVLSSNGLYALPEPRSKTAQIGFRLRLIPTSVLRVRDNTKNKLLSLLFANISALILRHTDVTTMLSR